MKSILVEKTPNYRHKQDIITYNTMILKHPTVICNKITSSASIAFLFLYIFFIILNSSTYREFGVVKSILVEKTPNYRRRQGIIMYNTMILKHLKVIYVLATSLAWFAFISYVYHIPSLKMKSSIILSVPVQFCQ